MCSLTTFLQAFLVLTTDSSSPGPGLLRTVVKTKNPWRKVVNEHICWLRFGQKGQFLSGQDRGSQLTDARSRSSCSRSLFFHGYAYAYAGPYAYSGCEDNSFCGNLTGRSIQLYERHDPLVGRAAAGAREEGFHIFKIRIERFLALVICLILP